MKKVTPQTRVSINSDRQKPLQARSRKTLDRIVNAINKLLESHYFEDLTIAQIAAEAGVSVGVCYQRFKDKDDMLALIYEQYDSEISQLMQRMAQPEQWTGMNHQQQASHWVHSLYNYYRDRDHQLRTIYLHLRLKPHLADPMFQQIRRQQMAEVIHAMTGAAEDDPAVEALMLKLYPIVLTLIDLVLFWRLPPAWLNQHETETIVNNQIEVLAGLLKDFSNRNS